MVETEGNSVTTAILNESLTKKLVLVNHPKGKKISAEGAAAASELLRTFVIQARHRAGIEAECDKEANMSENGSIEAHHVTKIAAELVMDFS